MDLFKDNNNIDIPLLNPQPQTSGFSISDMLSNAGNNIINRNQGIAGSFMALSRDPTTNQMGQNLLLQQANKDRIAREQAQQQFQNELATQEFAKEATPKAVGEFAYLRSLKDTERYQTDPEFRADIDNRMDYVSKATDAMYNQAFATQQGKLQGQLGLAAEVEAEKAFEKTQAVDKAKAIESREKNKRQLETMMPRVSQAIDRAKIAIEEGTGLGQFGGVSVTTDTGGQNRADINNAQAQINILMRGLLSDMGVGSSELNSATEAAAYRYQISQDMPKGQILRIMQNFEDDYKSGALEDSVASVASQYGGNVTQPAQAQTTDYSSMSDDDLLKGL